MALAPVYEHRETIIPGLPDDLACLCLASAAFSDYGKLKLVSKAWRSVLTSEYLFELRKLHKKTEELLCLFRNDPSLTAGELFDPKERKWGLIPPMPCDPQRYGLTNFACLGVLGQLYVMGGWVFDARSFPLEAPIPSSRVFRYNPVRSTWERRTHLREPRGNFACAPKHDGSAIFVAGGASRQGNRSGELGSGFKVKSLEVYDVEKDRWWFEAELPEGRAGCVGFVRREEEFWVMGGHGASTAIGGVVPVDACFKNGGFFKAGKWNEIGDMWEDGERCRLGKVAVVRGLGKGDEQVFMLQDFMLYRYNFAFNRWEKESSLPQKIVAAEPCGLVALHNELYVVPGISQTDFSFYRRPRRERLSLIFQIYNPQKQIWRSISTKPPIRSSLKFPWAAMCSLSL